MKINVHKYILYRYTPMAKVYTKLFKEKLKSKKVSSPLPPPSK